MAEEKEVEETLETSNRMMVMTVGMTMAEVATTTTTAETEVADKIVEEAEVQGATAEEVASEITTHLTTILAAEAARTRAITTGEVVVIPVMETETEIIITEMMTTGTRTFLDRGALSAEVEIRTAITINIMVTTRATEETAITITTSDRREVVDQWEEAVDKHLIHETRSQLLAAEEEPQGEQEQPSRTEERRAIRRIMKIMANRSAAMERRSTISEMSAQASSSLGPTSETLARLSRPWQRGGDQVNKR